MKPLTATDNEAMMLLFKLPGLNPLLKLRPYQKNAVARALLCGGNTLLAHTVAPVNLWK